MGGPDVRLITADAILGQRSLPEKSVHAAITSPPYYGLRDYSRCECAMRVSGLEDDARFTEDGASLAWRPTKPDPACPKCHGSGKVPGLEVTWSDGWHGQLGLEPTPGSYIEHLVDIFRETRRVLRDDGTLWIVIGDSYFGDSPVRGSSAEAWSESWDPAQTRSRGGSRRSAARVGDLKPMDQMMVPTMLAAALRADGWTLRKTIVWAKPNCLEGTQPIYCRSNGKPLRTTVREMARLPMPGLELPTRRGWTHVRRIDAMGRYPTRTMHLRSGSRVQATDEHRFPTTKGMLRVDRIRRRDCLEAARLPDERGTPLGTPELGWIVGLYLAEGSPKHRALQFSLHRKETANAERIHNHAEQFAGTAAKYDNEGKSMSVVVSGKAATAAILQYVSGTGARGKHLARPAWAESNAFLEAVLDGYLAGDGHYEPHTRRWQLGFTRNYELAEDLRTVAARLGYSMRLRSARTRGFGKTWSIIRGHLRKQTTTHWNSRDDHEVVSINKTSGTVYEISIDDPHIFALSDGTLTHNSMPESVQGWRWVRHKIKTRGDSAPNNGGLRGPSVDGWTKETHPETRTRAEWVPCPGCDVCTPNDGLVLRRASWRPTSSFEYVLLLSKTDEYYGDGEAVREESMTQYRPSDIKKLLEDRDRIGGKTLTHFDPLQKASARTGIGRKAAVGNPRLMNPRIGGQRQPPEPGEPNAFTSVFGRNLRDVWTIPTEPYSDAHFATFPVALVRRCILASTPDAVCGACGAPYARVLEESYVGDVPNGPKQQKATARVGGDWEGVDARVGRRFDVRKVRESSTRGWRATCRCKSSVASEGASPGPAVILDMFAGSGTVGQVARENGRSAVLIELHPYYADLIRERARIGQRPLDSFAEES